MLKNHLFYFILFRVRCADGFNSYSGVVALFNLRCVHHHSVSLIKWTVIQSAKIVQYRINNGKYRVAQKFVHFPTHHNYGTVQNRMKRIASECS